jgi:pimeloyl-ACP methyl ester carboxylesterase
MRIPLLGEFIYTRLRKDPDAAYKTLESFYYDLNRLPQKDQDFLYLRVNQRVWSNGQRRAYFSTLRNLIPWIKRQQQGLELRLQGLKTPVLVIRGEFDSLFSQTDSENIKEVQTHADFVQIDSTGHLPHQEDPESFLNFVNRWMFENFG